jgi:hypothetical protein
MSYGCQLDFHLEAHLRRQQAFSEKTFGPGARVEGVTDHIAKELAEVRESGGALAEWVDVIILGFDGAWRSGATPEQIVAAIVAKQKKNEARAWPDWRTAEPGKAIEHNRSADTSPHQAQTHAFVREDWDGRGDECAKIIGASTDRFNILCRQPETNRAMCCIENESALTDARTVFEALGVTTGRDADGEYVTAMNASDAAIAVAAFRRLGWGEKS